jgi:hypothetical protein
LIVDGINKKAAIQRLLFLPPQMQTDTPYLSLLSIQSVREPLSIVVCNAQIQAARSLKSDPLFFIVNQKKEKHGCCPFPLYSFGRTDLCIVAIADYAIGAYLSDLRITSVSDNATGFNPADLHITAVTDYAISAD